MEGICKDAIVVATVLRSTDTCPKYAAVIWALCSVTAVLRKRSEMCPYYAGWFGRRGQFFLGGGAKRYYRPLWEQKFYEHVYNSERLLRSCCLNIQIRLCYIFVCGVGWRGKFTKEMWIHETNCSLAFGCCCLHKETWRSSQTNITWFSHTSCEVHWVWRWDFRTFIVNCNRFVVAV